MFEAFTGADEPDSPDVLLGNAVVGKDSAGAGIAEMELWDDDEELDSARTPLVAALGDREVTIVNSVDGEDVAKAEGLAVEEEAAVLDGDPETLTRFTQAKDIFWVVVVEPPYGTAAARCYMSVIYGAFLL